MKLDIVYNNEDEEEMLNDINISSIYIIICK